MLKDRIGNRHQSQCGSTCSMWNHYPTNPCQSFVTDTNKSDPYHSGSSDPEDNPVATSTQAPGHTTLLESTKVWKGTLETLPQYVLRSMIAAIVQATPQFRVTSGSDGDAFYQVLILDN